IHHASLEDAMHNEARKPRPRRRDIRRDLRPSQRPESPKEYRRLLTSRAPADTNLMIVVAHPGFAIETPAVPRAYQQTFANGSMAQRSAGAGTGTLERADLAVDI